MAQKNTSGNDIKEFSMAVDHGGPLLLWDDETSNEKTKKGIIIDTLFCDNSECRAVHIHVILVDEQFEYLQLDAAKLLADYFDSNTSIEHYQKQKLQGSFDVDTGELHIQTNDNPQPDNTELLNVLSKQLSKGLTEVFERRWRAAKQSNQDAWKRKDWSWWQPGELVTWHDIYPDDFQFVFYLSEKRILCIDHYCITPECGCNDMAITFFDMKAKSLNELGAIFTDTSKLKVQDIDLKAGSKDTLLKCWDQFYIKYPDLKKTFQKRQKELRRIGVEIAKLSGNFNLPIEKKEKVKRNDPCPCGSGKKYKKCCIDK